jgi:hypothetical protein
MSVLSQLELEAKTIRPIEKGQSGWSQLPKGKLDLLSNSVEIVTAILKVHRLLLEKFTEAGSLETHGKLFWATFGYFIIIDILVW